MNYMPSRSELRITKPKLFIFDFDGTLAETEILSAEIVAERLARQGISMDPRRVSAVLSGAAKEKDHPLLEGLTGHALEPDFMDHVRADWRTAISKGIDPTAGAEDMLRNLSVPFCIASNASRIDLVHRLRAANLLSLVGPRFFSSDDVGFRKPDPAVFLLASEVMGVHPSECLVVEDSTVGLEAAKRARMSSCAFVGGRHHSDEMRATLARCEPDLLISDLRELTKFFR